MEKEKRIPKRPEATIRKFIASVFSVLFNLHTAPEEFKSVMNNVDSEGMLSNLRTNAGLLVSKIPLEEITGDIIKKQINVIDTISKDTGWERDKVLSLYTHTRGITEEIVKLLSKVDLNK